MFNVTLPRRLLASDAPAAVFVIRLLVGTVFLSEGVQKFLFPDDLGVGRFIKIGIPSPEILAPFIGGVEIIGGLLLLIGLCTRLAAVFLIADMMVAIWTTKLPILAKDGFWKMAYEACTDWSMSPGSLYLLIVGAGVWSLDARLTKNAEGQRDGE